MSTDLVVLQNELTVAKQQNEILRLRFELERAQAQKTSRLEDSLFAPALYEHYQKVAVALAKSSVVPTIYRNKPEDIFVAMAMGYQLGFPVEQSLQDIAVINGRPCLWGDGLLSLALNHPECQSITEQPIRNSKGDIIGYQCTVMRRGHEPHTKQFTLQDATVAGLLSRGTVWKAYPERMLQMRARSYAIRDKFADALRGLRIYEIEEEDSHIIDAEVSAPVGETQVDKLKSILNVSASEVITESDPTNISVDEFPIFSSQLDKISDLFKEKSFSEDRVQKAFDYYKITSLDELTSLQAESFISQLEKS